MNVYSGPNGSLTWVPSCCAWLIQHNRVVYLEIGEKLVKDFKQGICTVEQYFGGTWECIGEKKGRCGNTSWIAI